MFVDELTQFADDLSAARATGTAVLGDVIDVGPNSLDPGAGQPMYLVVIATATVTAASAGTIAVALTSADNEALTANAQNHHTSRQFATNTAANSDVQAGTVLARVAIPMDDYGRYIGVRTIIGGQATTGGTISAFLTQNVDRWQAYPDALN